MRVTKSPKIAALRLVEALPRASMDGRRVVLDGEHSFSERPWIENLGILVDLAIIQGMSRQEAWEACRYQPTASQEGLVVRDRGWTSQGIRWLLRGHPTMQPAPLS